MEYFLHLFYGILMAYFGLIAPGMLNMTALRTRLTVDTKNSFQFAFGASFIVFFQAGIALYFANYFKQNPNVINSLKLIGVFVFFGLSFFFFVLSKKEIKKNAEVKKGNYFFRGIFMSSINMLAIPFYLGTSLLLASRGSIKIEQPFILLFVFGAALGSFLLFATYIKFAEIINTRIAFIAKNINIILSLLFLVLGIVTLVKLLV